MNEVHISGWLTGKPVAIGEKEYKGVRFSIRAVNKYWSKDGEITEKSNIVNCVVFHCPKKLEAILLKGDKVWIEGAGGRLATSSYIKDGQKKFATNVAFDASDITAMER